VCRHFESKERWACEGAGAPKNAPYECKEVLAGKMARAVYPSFSSYANPRLHERVGRGRRCPPSCRCAPWAEFESGWSLPKTALGALLPKTFRPTETTITA